MQSFSRSGFYLGIAVCLTLCCVSAASNAALNDDDDDGVIDTEDDLPLDSTESVDTDGDGVGNNADADDDGDGYLDSAEIAAGTDPLSSESFPSEDEEGSGGLPIWMLYIATQPKAA
jgi:hypothetical protein